MAEISPNIDQYIRRVLIAAGIVAAFLILAILLWQVSYVLLIVFAGILFALFLDGLAYLVSKGVPLSRLWSLGLTIVLLIALLVAFGWLAGPQVADQIERLGERIPEAVDRIRELVAREAWAQAFLGPEAEPEQMLPPLPTILTHITDIFTMTLGAITGLIIILLIGLYIAINPQLYVDSLVHLLPKTHRQRGREVLQAVGHALSWWLVGQMATMVAVGVMISIGLWLIDMPLVAALGFIAGLLTFVPYLGPIIAAIPAILVALVEAPLLVVYVIVVYAIVEFLESNVISPLIQRRVVSLPPAVLVAAQIVMGVLLGVFGVLLAAPLAIAAIVFVQMVYIEGVLGEAVEVLGEGHESM